jgi:hypothetical protein
LDLLIEIIKDSFELLKCLCEHDNYLAKKSYFDYLPLIFNYFYENEEFG